MAWGSDIDVEEREKFQGSLAFSKSSETYGQLCYCIRTGNDAGHLIFPSSDFIKIWFSWADDIRDLDIFAYWNGYSSDQSRGFSHGKGPMDLIVGGKTFMLAWSGDLTGAGVSEWIGSKPLVGEVMTINLNFYGSGMSQEDYDAAAKICSILVKYIPTGATTQLSGVSCGGNKGKAAQTSDPAATFTFKQTVRGIVATVSAGGKSASLNLF